MLELSKSIYGKLSGSALAAHIGSRLFPGQAPDGAEYPYAVFLVVASSPDNVMGRFYEDTLIQFSLFSATSDDAEAHNMYADLKTLYDECSMTITGQTLIWMRRENASLMVEDHTTPAGTVKVWHYAVDYRVTTKV